MGLIHPTSVDDWAAWERSRRRARSAKASLLRLVRPPTELPLVLHQRGDAPSTLVALDVARGTSVDALLAPVEAAVGGVAVVTRGQIPDGVLAGGWRSRTLADLDELPASVRQVLSAGAFSAVSLPVHRWAVDGGVRFVVVQHGLLTPFAPPLPEGSHLLAWSEEDAAFWSEGRDDVTSGVVGSQLLWRAAQRVVPVSSERPVFLGQLHGTELDRREVAGVSGRFCRATGADYRPHPGERDLLSRTVHAWWRRRGVTFESSGVTLAELARPAVSIFSTGVLEAAAQGLPAWGVHPSPPAWLSEVWERYAFGRWGGEPTRRPPASEEPALVIARMLRA